MIQHDVTHTFVKLLVKAGFCGDGLSLKTVSNSVWCSCEVDWYSICYPHHSGVWFVCMQCCLEGFSQVVGGA